LHSATDSGVYAGSRKNIDLETKAKNWHGHVSAIGGIACYEGLLNTGRHRAAFTVSPVIGLKYTLGYKSRLSLNSGLLYAPRQGLNSKRSYESYRYGFGSIRQAYTVAYNSLHYLEVPLYIRWRISGIHHVTFGGSFSYQLFTIKRVSMLEETLYQAPVTREELKIGQDKSFTTSDVSILFGYEHYLGKRLGMAVRLEYGLSDLTSNARFHTAITDNNIRGLLLLEYALGR
jgi:hypothetical protein